MEENNITSEFDARVDSILNAATEKENKRKDHWWNNLRPCDWVGILLIGYVILVLICLFWG